MAGDLRLLLVEDNAGDAGLIEAMLEDEGGARLDWVESLDAGVKAMTEGDYDAVLLDLSLPDSDGVESVATTVLFDAEVPVIVLTGLASEDMAFQALREGAQDYLVKGTIDGPGLLRTIRFAIERCAVQRDLAAHRGRTAPRDAAVRALVVPQDGRLDHLAAVMASLVQHGHQLVVVCVERPADLVRARLDESGIDGRKVHLIDASGARGMEDSRVHVVDDPRDLDVLGLEVERACAALGPDAHVVLDSINGLLVHHRVETVGAFLHGMANRLRLLGIPADIVAHDTQDWPFLADRLSFLDEAVHVVAPVDEPHDPSVQ